MKNLRWANDDRVGICYDTDSSVVFVDGGELYDQIVAGQYGSIADPAVIDEPFIKPTQDQIDALRKSAYQSEADPLFFKWQRGESTQQEWLDKIADIRNRYPDVIS